MRFVWVFVIVAAGCSKTDLKITPNVAYVGFETDSTVRYYYVPLALSGTFVGARWSTPDTTMLDVHGWDCGAEIAGLKAGTNTVTVATDNDTDTISVTAIGYTAAQWAAGEQFYMQNNCAGCHAGAGQPDITPSGGTGHHPDEHLMRAITMGLNPEGGDISIGRAAHTFPIAVGTPAYAGIAAYLRSLTPKGPVTIDE